MRNREIETLLEGAAAKDKRAVKVACELFDERYVDVINPDDVPAGSYAFAYHLGSIDNRVLNRELRNSRCAMLDKGRYPRSNGVVMGSEHSDLRCSHRSCSYRACPVAMAACFAQLSKSGEDDNPVYVKHKDELAEIEAEVNAFRAKWESHLENSTIALNLLLDMHENDFAGMLVVDDESYRDDFIADLGRILQAMDKIDGKQPKEMHLVELVGLADSAKARFKTTGDENLKARVLYVFDRVNDFVNLNPMLGDSDKKYVIERLSHIVDNRYVLLVGTESELRGFTNLDSRLMLTYDQHQLHLDSMPHEELYQFYLEDLNAPLRAQALSQPGFERQFERFVGFNKDCMPFRGQELADFLAKHANSLGELSLPTSRYQSSSLDEMLDEVVGLTQVKDTIRQLERYAVFSQEAHADNRQTPSANMHMLFLGNPGTGKTMVARIIATMLYKIGIIRQNKCIEVTSKDLIGKYVGHTDKQTAEVIQSALGGILFIDEAYALASGGESTADFGRESIAELVKSMDDYKDDLIVIFAGYEKEMNEFIEMNSGMASRIGYTFRFDDYSTPELMEIFRRNASKAGLNCDDPQLKTQLENLFDYYRRFKNFGNGRFAAEVLQKAVIKHAVRNADNDEDYVLCAEDIPTKQELFNMTDWSPRGADDLLAGLVGIEEAKAKVREFEKVVAFREEARRRGLKLPDSNLNMVFTGNPGTGKTTLARIIAEILYNVGAVPTNKFIEVEANDLSAFQFRSSETAVEKHLKNAMGGVLFIDEAYALLYTRNGDEIISNLVKAMEDHKGEIVVMFAGYQQEMREFLDRNPGLASRVGYNFHLEDYKVDELLEIFKRKTDASGLRLDEGALAASRDVLRYFHGTENYGNGRFADKLLQEVIAKHANRADIEDFALLTAADVPSISEMCKLVSMPVYEPSDVSGEEARRRVALHEMGHAVCRLALTGGTDIVVVTIEQEGNGALGYVQHKASTTALPTAADLENEIVGLMGGMAAEELFCGAFSCGNASDLQTATRIAGNYVAKYGMSPAGFVQYLGDVRRGQQPASLVDLPPMVLEQVNAVMKRSFERAKQVIQGERERYDRLVDELLRKSTISGDDIMRLWNGEQCNG